MILWLSRVRLLLLHLPGLLGHSDRQLGVGRADDGGLGGGGGLLPPGGGAVQPAAPGRGRRGGGRLVGAARPGAGCAAVVLPRSHDVKQSLQMHNKKGQSVYAC